MPSSSLYTYRDALKIVDPEWLPEEIKRLGQEHPGQEQEVEILARDKLAAAVAVMNASASQACTVWLRSQLQRSSGPAQLSNYKQEELYDSDDQRRCLLLIEDVLDRGNKESSRSGGRIFLESTSPRPGSQDRPREVHFQDTVTNHQFSSDLAPNDHLPGAKIGTPEKLGGRESRDWREAIDDELRRRRRAFKAAEAAKEEAERRANRRGKFPERLRGMNERLASAGAQHEMVARGPSPHSLARLFALPAQADPLAAGHEDDDEDTERED